MARPTLRWSRRSASSQAVQIGLKVVFAGPGGAVDTLQLRLGVVAPPIGARELGQLERLAHQTRRGQVRPAAEVLPLALMIDGDRLVLGQVADDLGLVGLAHGLEAGDGGVSRHDLAREAFAALHDLAHPGFDLGQIVQTEGRFAGEVVIEAVLDGGADGDLRAGEELLHRLRHHMAGVVADHLQDGRIVARQEGDGAGHFERAVVVEERAVQLGDHRLLGQRRRKSSAPPRAAWFRGRTRAPRRRERKSGSCVTREFAAARGPERGRSRNRRRAGSGRSGKARGRAPARAHGRSAPRRRRSEHEGREPAVHAQERREGQLVGAVQGANGLRIHARTCDPVIPAEAETQSERRVCALNRPRA